MRKSISYTWEEKDVHEALVGLYLRLNGYFTSGFIVHASEEKEAKVRNITELDILAVRFPFNQEPGREVNPSKELALQKTVQINLLIEPPVNSYFLFHKLVVLFNACIRYCLFKG